MEKDVQQSFDQIDLMQLDKVINGVSRPYCFFSIPKVD